jgi:hypothetical protein
MGCRLRAAGGRSSALSRFAQLVDASGHQRAGRELADPRRRIYVWPTAARAGAPQLRIAGSKTQSGYAVAYSRRAWSRVWRSLNMSFKSYKRYLRRQCIGPIARCLAEVYCPQYFRRDGEV